MAIKKKIIIIDNCEVDVCRDNNVDYSSTGSNSSNESNDNNPCYNNSKNYYILNKESKLEYQKEYYDSHREERIEYQKQYNLLNDDKLKDYQKSYYEKTKEIKLQKLREKVECDCGNIVSRSGYNAHLKTKLHLKRLAAKSC